MSPRPVLALLLILAPAGARAEEGEWVCQRTYRFGEHFFWVTAVLDPDGRPRERLVRWRTSGGHEGSELGWTLPAAGKWYDRPSDAAAQMGLDRVPGLAVWSRLWADGRRLDQRLQVDRRQARRHRKGQGLLLHVSFPPPAAVPQLHGVRELRMEAVGGDGRRLAARILPLPDWAQADRFVAEGLREIEAMAADRQAKCQQDTGPEI